MKTKKDVDILGLFEKEGAFLKGHFRLTSGLHSPRYLQCALILQTPSIAEKLAKALAGRFKDEKIDLVIGPAIGGIIFAYELAREFGVRGIFTEREQGMMTLRRGFSIKAGERALIVEDVITTGGSTREVIDVVKAHGGIAVGVASLIDRSGGVDFGVRFESLAKVTVETCEEEKCPLCKAGMPIVKPGSRK